MPDKLPDPQPGERWGERTPVFGGTDVFNILERKPKMVRVTKFPPEFGSDGFWVRLTTFAKLTTGRLS